VARDPGDHPLAQLDAALRVAPSPAAAARVRERVRQEPVRASHGWWSVAAASVAVVAVGIATSTLLVSRREVTPSVAAVATVPSTPVAASAPAPFETAPVRVLPNVAGRTAHAAPPPPAVVLAPARPRELEVLVPPDEGIALRKLLMAVRDGRAVVPAPGVRAMEAADGHLLEPTPIEIPLIKIELLPGTPVAGSGGTVK